MFDTKVSEFAVFDSERKTFMEERKTYNERVGRVPNLIKEAVNIDSPMRSLVPILTILAIDPTNVMDANDKIEKIFHTFLFPQSSPLGSQVISDDPLPATINNPSDSSGILNVTYYLLFARIGQFLGALVSYLINSIRDWREGKKQEVVYDKSSSAELLDDKRSEKDDHFPVVRRKKEVRVGALSSRYAGARETNADVSDNEDAKEHRRRNRGKRLVSRLPEERSGSSRIVRSN